MITIKEFRVFTPRSVYLRWDVASSSPVVFKIYRGVSLEDMKHITTIRRKYYTDVSVIKEAVTADIYYKIEGLSLSGEVVDTVEFPITSENLVNYAKFHKYFEDNFLRAAMGKAAGHSFALLIQKYSGTPCPVCAHSVTGEATNPNCATCHGTGIEGGYYDPIVFYGILGRMQRSSFQNGMENHYQKEVTSITMYAYPNLKVNDILVDLETNDRYIILDIGTAPAMYNRTKVGTVTYTMEMLPPTHHSYSFEVVPFITAVNEVVYNIVVGEVVVHGRRLLPRFGALSLVIYGSEFSEEVTLTANDVKTITNEKIVFSSPTEIEGWGERHYKCVLNNLIFDGDVKDA